MKFGMLIACTVIYEGIRTVGWLDKIHSDVSEFAASFYKVLPRLLLQGYYYVASCRENVSRIISPI